MFKAVLFDMGGTLENVVHTPERSLACGKKILAYLAAHGIYLDIEPEIFAEECELRNKAYRKWGTEHHRELSPYEIWLTHFLNGRAIDQEKLRIIAENLTIVWERNFNEHAMRKETPELLAELKKRGIAMGLVSNTISYTNTIEKLHEMGIRHYFGGCVYLSSVSGCRKPGKQIFIEAAADLGVKPEEAVYVGDTISRDVRGARAAGYFASIRIVSEITAISDAGFNTGGEEADYCIKNLLEILPIVDFLEK